MNMAKTWMIRIGMFAVLAQVLSGAAQAGVAPNCTPVPEIDPGSAIAAVTLLTAGVMTIRDRLARRS